MKRSHVERLLDGWALACDAFVVGVLIYVMVALVGCGKSEPPAPAKPAAPITIPAPEFNLPGGFDPDKPVEMRYVEEGGESKSTEQATGTGAGLSTSSDEAAAKFVTSAPGATLPGIGSTGGGTSTEFSVRTIQGAASNPLLWVGIFAVLLGGFCLWRVGVRPAMIAFGVGGGFIAAAMLPGWGWVLMAVFAMLGLGVYCYVEWDARRSKSALQAVVDGVAATKESAPDAYVAVKREIGKQATASDRRVIDQRKASSDVAPAT